MITNGSQLAALVSAWAGGDPRRFHTVAMQAAANLARGGDAESARSIRDTLDGAYSEKTYLPAYGGGVTDCTKCLYDLGAAVRYIKEGTVDFLERECPRCGYTWYERCADVRPDSDG